MAIKSYILTKTFDSPCVQVTGMAHRPQALRAKRFLKDQIIQGELKHANNKPAFVLVAGTFVIPVSVLREITSKDITSNASGGTSKEEGEKKPIKLPPVNKVKYVDGVFFGAILGVGVTFLAEKQGWIPAEENAKKNKIIGALIGSAVGMYAVYRYKTLKTDKKDEKE